MTKAGPSWKRKRRSRASQREAKPTGADGDRGISRGLSWCWISAWLQRLRRFPGGSCRWSYDIRPRPLAPTSSICCPSLVTVSSLAPLRPTLTRSGKGLWLESKGGMHMRIL